MKKRNFENRKEDYLINTKITQYLKNGDKDNTSVQNVLCKVYLPIKVSDSISLVFHLTDEQYKIFDHDKFWKCAVESIENNFPEHYVPQHTAVS